MAEGSDVAALAGAIRAGDRAALPRAITLVESTRPDHREQAQRLLLELMPDAGKAMHVGITGVPGVGKGRGSGPDELERYYTDIRGGRRPSPEHLAQLRGRYEAIGNAFPLLDTTRAQADGLIERLNAGGADTGATASCRRDGGLGGRHPRGPATRAGDRR